MQMPFVKQEVQLSPVHIECLKQSIYTTFSTVCGNGLKYLGLSSEAEVNKTEGIIGIISIVGDVSWALMLGFPRRTASTLAPVFAGFDIPYESEDMGDIVGELANIAAGDLVARLEVVGIRSGLSLPTVARASDLELLLPDRTPSIQMDFSAREREFWLKVAVRRPHRTFIS